MNGGSAGDAYGVEEQVSWLCGESDARAEEIASLAERARRLASEADAVQRIDVPRRRHTRAAAASPAADFAARLGAGGAASPLRI
ncbi:hypothetical protein DIPPA_07000 [Diplonema papillatum]|nr:hypothetical protein DIPPA_07000 [Diplonema papillatum]